MSALTCNTCLKPKPGLRCGACAEPVCKNCAQFVDEGVLKFLAHVPPALKHGTYCARCYDSVAAPELTDYEEVMARAREIYIFYVKEGKSTRAFDRKEKPLKVEDCIDREEVVMRLAFLAAKAGFNTLLDVDVTSKKVRSNGYQTSVWSGVGVPYNADPKTIERLSGSDYF